MAKTKRKPNRFAKELGVQLRKRNLKGKTKLQRQQLFKEAAKAAKRIIGGSPAKRRPSKKRAATKARTAPKRRRRRSGMRAAETRLAPGASIARGEFPDPGSLVSGVDARAASASTLLLTPGGPVTGSGVNLTFRRPAVDPNRLLRGAIYGA